MKHEPSLPADDDLEAGLAAGYGFPSPPVLTAIERSAGTVVPRVTLREQNAGRSTPGAPPSAHKIGSVFHGRTSYRLEGEIAQGGMGVLLKCRDLDLGRDVALKVLREDLAARPEFVQRFVEEAQIGGQLQHPGIVPVYELGLMADQRPYFAMKLVQGRTLAAVLAERAAAERRELLDVFASVCQTMAYSHARGVVHRDLKPENVLIGGFGEVQVIDWGLAKVLAAGGTADEPYSALAPAPEPASIATVRSGSSSGGTPSIAGAVMGTPAYMAPEQARGEVGRIDERSDVFALGAMLCEILTGDPPYRGAHQRAIAQAGAAQVEDAHARLERCDADRELIDLCRACLAPEPARRPRSAAALASRMQHYLASLEHRARRAEVRTAELRVRARSVAILVSLVSVVVLAALGGAWAWRENRAQRAAEVERAVSSALNDATLARGREDWPAAETALALAQARSESPFAAAALRARVATVRADVERELEDARARDELERDDAAWMAELEKLCEPEGDEIYPTDWAELDAKYASAFAAREVLVDAREPAELARRLSARGISTELAAALDDWTLARRHAGNEDGAERLRQLADALDPDPLRGEVRAAQASEDEDALRAISERTRAEPLPPRTLRLLARKLRAWGQPERAVDLLQAARLREVQDYGLALELGRSLRMCRPPRGEEACAAYETAIALRPTSVAAWHELGMTLDPILGRPAEALEVVREAVKRFPDDDHLHFHLGTALAKLDRHAEAVESLRRAANAAPLYAPAWCNLAIALDRVGRSEESLAAYERALEADPLMFEANNDLGVALRKVGRLDEAIERLEQALVVRPDFAPAHTELAFIHVSRGDLDAAIEHARRAIELEPRSSYDHFSLGRALAKAGRDAEARTALERCVALAPAYAPARLELALVLLTSDDAAVRDGELALERLAALTPDDVQARALVGVALYASGDFEAARESFEREEELDPGAPSRALFRGLCALRLGHEDEAYTLLEELDLGALQAEEPVVACFVEEARAFLAGD